MKISEFQTKDVINVVDGRRLGQISDLELDLNKGIIEAIVVPGYSKFMGLFGNGSDLIIPWKSIVKIGSDVVLVKMEEAHPQQNRTVEPEVVSYVERDAREYRELREGRGDRRNY